jgi:hypothetical protein
MAHTQSDLESVEAAIVALAACQRVIDVVINGVGVQYGRLDLDEMRALRAEIQRELRAIEGRIVLSGQDFPLTIGTGEAAV